MPLDLDADDDVVEKPAAKARVAKPKKQNGKPESPQSMVKRGSNPWPKGQRVVVTEGELHRRNRCGGSVVVSLAVAATT